MSLKNQNVCVISYAKYMNGKKMGKIIDSFDKVVRINNGINIDKKDIEDFGKKTDIYAGSFCGGKNCFITKTYNYLNNTKEKINIFGVLKKYKVKDIFICKSKSKNIEECAQNHKRNVLIPNEQHIEWAITTGLQAIINALRLKPKKLFLAGFSFTMELHPSYEKYYLLFKGDKIKNSLNKNYDKDPNCKHSTIFEKYLLKKLQKRYKISVDTELKKILKKSKLSELDNIMNEKLGKKYIDIFNEIITFIDK